MRTEDYTPDAICQVMGLSRFVDPDWSKSHQTVLRLLLKPSFHPEVCVTFTATPTTTTVSVTALCESFWQVGTKIPMPAHAEQRPIARDTVDELERLFMETVRGSGPDGKFIAVDGMGAEACLVSAQATERYGAHVWRRTEFTRFVARAVEVAWSSCLDIGVLNALARVGEYVDLKLALVEEPRLPAKPPVTRMMILGEASERQEILNAIARHKTKQP
jgi:hypothetical protein